MGHSIHIYEDPDPACVAEGGTPANDGHDSAGDLSSAPTVAENNSCSPQPETSVEPAEAEAGPSTDSSPRVRQKRIFLLLTLALLAAPLAEAAHHRPTEPLSIQESWETRVHGLWGRDHGGPPVDLGGPMGPAWQPPAGALGHGVDRRVVSETGRETRRPLCSVDIGLTASPPALSIRARLIGVPLPEVQITLGRLARIVLGWPAS
jgi:hypothetical protein